MTPARIEELRQWCPKNNNGSGVVLTHVEKAIQEAIAAAENLDDDPK